MSGVLPKHLMPRVRIVLATSAVITALWVWVAIVHAVRTSTAMRIEVPELARNVGAGLFLIAGVLRMASWRLTSDWAAARSALTLLIVGTALPASAVLGKMLHTGPVAAIEAPAARLFFVLPLVALAVAAARNPRRRWTIAGIVATVAVTVFVTVHAAADGALAADHDAALWLFVEAVAAGAWCAIAVQAWPRRELARTRSALDIGIAAMLLMAAAEVLKAWSIVDAQAPHGAATGVQLIAALMTALAAARLLAAQFQDRVGDSNDLGRALVDTRQQLERIVHIQRERLHDARSAVLGVVGASRLLTDPPKISTIEPGTLHALVARELARLEGLLNVDQAGAVADFELDDAIRTVVLAHRIDGMIIHADLGKVRAMGDPRATATVLDNLLRNAGKHAPRASVQITAREIDGHVEISVRDDGPGIPAAERSAVLRAGVRGSTARGDGSGLGLYSACSAMAAQGGSLRIAEPSARGTEIVLTLPATAVVAIAS
ncbi:MAG: sensor histidine kinase [Jatrophihabitantaceae bacterium]